MNKISFVTLLLIAICVVLLSSNTESRRMKCGKFCLKSALNKKIKGSEYSECFKQCLSMSKDTKDDTSELIELVKQVKQTLTEDIQEKEAVLVEEEKVESESFAPTTGSYLTVTASSLNIRSSASTSASILRSVASGTVLKFTGYILTKDGYTWYGVQATDGSFSGTGYAASNFLKEGGSPSPTPTPSGNYPLFKQCDSRWGSNMISTKTVCQVGCLMSSVAMALNGMGKRLSNGNVVDPGTLNAWLKSNGGYSGNLFIWGSVSRYGLTYQSQTSSSTSIRNFVSGGRHVVILNVNNGGHWVLATGLTSTGFSVNDPGYSKTTYSNSEVVAAGIYSK